MSTKKIDLSDNLGDRLRTYRKKFGKNGIDFSTLIGISQGSLSDIETNKTKPSTNTLAGLIRNTDIDIEWLLTGEEKITLEKESSLNLSEEKRYNSAEKKMYPEILNEFKEWILEEIRKNPKKRDWLEIQLQDFFPAFRLWKEENDRKIYKQSNE